MNGKQQHGGRAYHSAMEPHLDFIREQRQRRKTWQEIAELLFSEKGIRVTLYAPYRFYRRKLKRIKQMHWEEGIDQLVSQPARPIGPVSRPAPSRSAPLPTQPAFKRPNRETFKPDEFV